MMSVISNSDSITQWAEITQQEGEVMLGNVTRRQQGPLLYISCNIEG